MERAKEQTNTSVEGEEKGHTNPTSSLTKKQRKISLTTEHDFRLSPKKGGKIPHVCHLILGEINLKRLRPFDV